MKHLDLFSGIGGFTLAAQSLGIQTVQFVEIHDYCCHVLTKNFPNIPIHRDIHTFHPQPNQYDLITGGSPCQDLSLAGTRSGITEERSSLWFEMLRVIDEAKPKFVVWENVKGAIYTGGLSEVLCGLSELGYGFDVEILSAAEVRICGKGSSWLPTPMSYSGKHRPGQTKLDLRLRLLPTPTATQGGDFPKQLKAYLPTGQVLNPQFVEWIMGFPIDWTDLQF